MLCTKISKRIAIELNGASKGGGRFAARRRTTQEINCDKALRASASLAEHIHLVDANEEADPAGQGIGDIVGNRPEVIKLHEW